MKKVVLLLSVFFLVSCSNSIKDKENGSGETKENKKEVVQKEDRLTPLPFDVYSLQEDLKKVDDLDPDKVDVYVAVSENTLISNFESLSENIIFLKVLATYIEDHDDQINGLIKELEESYDDGENYSSTININDVNIITTLLDEQLLISITSGDWVEKSVEKELKEDSQK